jgi:hypothetical protein
MYTGMALRKHPEKKDITLNQDTIACIVPASLIAPPLCKKAAPRDYMCIEKMCTEPNNPLYYGVSVPLHHFLAIIFFAYSGSSVVTCPLE